ncbi:hypothetical protein RZS08_10210, partial [Arthrospira platensis SPKY1]|nr:hypothetical protein [Arthrospira platensis SPKY1]
EAQTTGRIRSVLETYKLGLEEELNRTDAADIGSVSHIKSVRAVAGALINLIRMAEGELTPEFQNLYDGIGITATMQVLSPYDFDSLQNLFRTLQDSISDVRLVENAVVQFLNQLVKIHDKKFDDLFKELGITGIVFGHTPGESVKAIKRDVFGMDMYMVNGYGSVMQIGKAGIGIDGAL